MVQTDGYREVFKPFLEDKLNQAFPDPSKFTKEEEFVYAAKVSSVFKKVVGELLLWLDTSTAEADYLEKKDKGLIDKSFDIGK